ncbi:hypothetical protein RB195_007220 [Necator americanus]
MIGRYSSNGYGEGDLGFARMELDVDELCLSKPGSIEGLVDLLNVTTLDAFEVVGALLAPEDLGVLSLPSEESTDGADVNLSVTLGSVGVRICEAAMTTTGNFATGSDLTDGGKAELVAGLLYSLREKRSFASYNLQDLKNEAAVVLEANRAECNCSDEVLQFMDPSHVNSIADLMRVLADD